MQGRIWWGCRRCAPLFKWRLCYFVSLLWWCSTLHPQPPAREFFSGDNSYSISPAHSCILIVGRVAASHYTDKGGGSNYLCLPDHPLYTNPANISEDQTAHLYPVKYGKLMKIFNRFGPELLRKFPPSVREKFTRTLDFKDVPCAVCQVDGATSVLMIPANNVCPRRWSRQYHGYLMSQKHDYGKTEFICVDIEARGIPNTQNSNGNAFLHLTEFKCSGPSCKGFFRNQALPCTVCTTWTELSSRDHHVVKLFLLHRWSKAPAINFAGLYGPFKFCYLTI